jgi:hypothetical protein
MLLSALAGRYSQHTMLPSAHACLLLLQVDFDCETALQKLGLLLKAAVDSNVSPCH